MLSNFIFSINAVIPVFLIMLLGYELKRRELLSAGFLASGNKLLFYIALPIMLFRGVYTNDIRDFIDFRFIAFVLGITMATFFTLWGIASIFIKEKSVVASVVQGSFRGNFALMGIPIILNLAGNAGMARAALVVVFAIPFFNVLSIMVLAPCTGEKVGVKSVILAVLKNPSNILIAIGIILTLLNLSLPAILNVTMNSIANLASPLALLCIGGGMVFHGFDAKFKYAAIASAIKIIVVPIIFTTSAILLGFRDYDLAVILVLGGVPTATISYAMAAQMGGDTSVAGTIIVITTLASAVTLTLFIYVMRVLGLLVI